MKILLLLINIFVATSFASSSSNYELKKIKVNLNDKASLQRGFKTYMNYCSGCHSLKHARYRNVALDLHIVDSNGEVLDEVMKKGLMFNTDNINDYILSSMGDKDSINWFGKSPPDLTLAARFRSPSWIYHYLNGFYKDDNKTWGVNNLVFPDVGMPHVLSELQGTQLKKELSDGTISLVNLDDGQLTSSEYESLVVDLVNFLAYIAEPVKLKRMRIGGWVLIFLSIFIVFSYLLKREYWKKVQKE